MKPKTENFLKDSLSFIVSVGAHAVVFLFISIFLIASTPQPLPLLTEVTLMGTYIPKGEGSGTSLTPPSYSAEQAMQSSEAVQAKDPDKKTTDNKRQSDEKITAKEKRKNQKPLSKKEILSKFKKLTASKSGVQTPSLPETQSEESYAGIGNGTSLGMPTGTEVKGDILSRGVISLVKPECPYKLKSAMEVTLLISVMPDGRVVENVMVKALSGDPRLDTIAIESIKKWRFQPLPSGIQQVIQSGTISFKFVPR